MPRPSLKVFRKRVHWRKKVKCTKNSSDSPSSVSDVPVATNLNTGSDTLSDAAATTPESASRRKPAGIEEEYKKLNAGTTKYETQLLRYAFKNDITATLQIIVSSIAENSMSRVKRQDCGPQYFRCQNGKCIRNFKVCDGAADCSDKSDESKVTCKSRLCSSALFQCAYGACVDGNAACDGTIQCEGDGSDEAPELCGTSSAPMCTLPLKRKNGGYKVLGCDSQFCGFGPGAQVPSGTQLQFFCDEGYHISGPNDSYCLDETFTPPPPVCEKSRLFSTSSTLHYGTV
ncbi:modular serine protease-like [Schistocerca americana]|uniref:modular serine protease-like n=1 Tax=Schistocerca americana TaxID=7009 RepID=UPI001F4F38C1|nr:modular serine protease-like [Schistocerca americana]